MAITAADVKKLRELSGAGMMDCKKALTATNGDMDEAMEFLRKKGLATAQKKASRIAAEGLCKTLVAEDAKSAVVVEVNAETDFVAKNEKFQNYVAEVAEAAMETEAADIEAFLASPWKFDTTKTVKEALAAQVAVIGENMNIRRFEQVKEENGFVASYTHMGGKIGVLVDVASDVVNDEVKEMAKNVAMQVAALKPEFISEADISPEHAAKEKEVTLSKSLNSPDTLPKPVLNMLIDKAINEKIWSDEDIAIFAEKKTNMQFVFNFLSKEAKAQLAQIAMDNRAEIEKNKVFMGAVEGRIKKQLKEVCLMNQVYVKAEDGKQSVKDYIASVAKAQGAKIEIKKIVRYETGEGIEKKQENFAEEVAKQMGM